MIQENMLPWNIKRYRKTDMVAFPQTMATILIKECTQQGTRTVALLQLIINIADENVNSLFNQTSITEMSSWIETNGFPQNLLPNTLSQIFSKKFVLQL